MTDTVFDGVQTRLTHNLSFLRLPLSSDSVALRLSLSPSRTHLPGVVAAPPPLPCTHTSHGLIVLHLFIQAFMAASSSRGLISPANDGSLPRLSLLFIIGVHSHHISLTLGRWFSHWTTLPGRHITNLQRGARREASDTIRGEASNHCLFCRFNSLQNATRRFNVIFWTTFTAFHLFTV